MADRAASPTREEDLVPLSAHELRLEIERLYLEMQSIPCQDPAYTAVARQIRSYAARHWLITSGIALSDGTVAQPGQ